MSRTFLYVLLVITAYLFLVLPHMSVNSGQEEEQEEETENKADTKNKTGLNENADENGVSKGVTVPQNFRFGFVL